MPSLTPSSDQRPFKLIKAGYQPKYDYKGGRGNKAGYQRKKAGAIGDKSGLYVKTEMDESSPQYGRGRWSSKGGQRGPARNVQVPAAEEGSAGAESSIEGNDESVDDKEPDKATEKEQDKDGHNEKATQTSEKSINPGDMKRMHDTYNKLFNSDGTDGKVRGMETQDAKSEPESSTLRFMSIEDSVQWHTAITSGKQQDARKKGVPLR